MADLHTNHFGRHRKPDRADAADAEGAVDAVGAVDEAVARQGIWAHLAE
mgnify:CR=1 FL=1